MGRWAGHAWLAFYVAAVGLRKRDREGGAAGLEAQMRTGGRRGAGIVGLALRFALNAPPFGLRRASLRARPTTNKQQNRKAKKGTFRSSFDSAVCRA